MKKTVEDYYLKNKKVIIRVDFNVPINSSIIMDDTRIKSSLKTIQYCIKNGAKIILLSHLGRVKKEEDKNKYTLKPVSERLSELLHQKVKFVPNTRGKEVDEAVNQLQNGDILLLENTRYEDLDGNKESLNDQTLARYWASLGDIFINDAFGTIHRSHASNVGIATFLPSGIGYLVLEEIKMFEKVLNHPTKPFTVMLGGSKVGDKINIIKNLVTKADYILIAGAMAFTFLKAKNINIGKSLLEEESLTFCRDILSKYSNKIILPIDVLTAKEIKESSSPRYVEIDNIDDDQIALDIGEKTIQLFKEYLEKSKTIVWNGPVGYFEIDSFSYGTKGVCETLRKINALKIVGGGDTASAVIHFGYQDIFNHISTGGGASLKMLEGKELPALKVICDINE